MRSFIKERVRDTRLEGAARDAWTLTRGAGRALRLLERRLLGVDASLAEQYMSTASSRKLQLGCGANAIPGWLNSDLNPRSRDILYLDVTKRFPFRDDQIDYVFSEHLIEHLPFSDGQHMLFESFRVLRPAGKVRISTPDLRFLIDLYRNPKSPTQREYIEWSRQTYLDSAAQSTDTFVINNYVRDWGHQFIYDEKTLRLALERAGFVDIVRCAVNASDERELAGLENTKRMPPGFLELESLSLEGSKP